MDAAAGEAVGDAASSDRRAIAVMRQEIATIPEVIADQARNLRPRLRELAREVGRDLDEVVLSGCGDSHFAGLATRLAFERAAGVRCRPVEALELARYEIRYVPMTPLPLLVAVSHSGEVGRTIEAAASATARGWRTVALTGRPDGRLAGAVETPILIDVPTFGFSPGTNTYVAMVTALLVLAVELARERGRPAAADVLDAALERAPDLARRTLELAEDPARAAAEFIARAPVTIFLGAGPSRASAAFGAAKLFEGPQLHGVAQDLEEWAHEEYFVSGAGTPIVVVAPSGPSLDRALELLGEMAFIGARPIVVGDIQPPHGLHLPIAPGLGEAVSPLLTCLPLSLVAFFVAERLGRSSYGFASPEHEREHYETIHRDTRGEPA